MKKKLFAMIIRQRLYFLLAAATLTLFFGWFAAHAKFNTSLETYFFEEDLKDYNRFLDEFGSDEIIAIVFTDDDIFTQENLKLVDAITSQVGRLPHVRRVVSLTSARLVTGDSANVYFDPLIEENPEPGNDLAVIKNKALADPFIPGILISRDGRTTAIVAEIDHIIGAFDYKVKLISRIREILESQKKSSGKTFRMGGSSILDEAFFRYNQRDQSIFMPIMLALIMGIIYLMFRRWSLLVLPVVVVLLTIIWTYGLLVLLGYEINVITTIIPPLLMSVAIADSMHLLADYLHITANGEHSKLEAIEITFSNIFNPCLMTSLTTILGLISLLTADLAIIRQFGLVSAAGVLFAFILTIFLLPILVSFVPLPSADEHSKLRAGVFSRLLLWLGSWHQRRALITLLFAGAAVIPAVILLGRLNIGTNSLDYFKKGDEVRSQVEWIDAHIGGTVSLEFLVETGTEDALKEPELLQKIDDFQTYLRSIDGITGVFSVVDLVKSLNRGFNEGRQKYYSLPDDRQQISQLLLLVEGSDDLAELLSEDYASGRITARVEMNKSQQVSHAVPEIRLQMDHIFNSGETVTPTGIIYLMNRTEHYLLSTSIKSFLLAFLVITLSIMLMLRSVRLGILAMVPNLLPILFTMALMPLLNISLDVGTTMIAAIALGLVVDDTIHFLSRIRLALDDNPDPRRAIAEAMSSVGRPIVYTSIVLGAGFLTLVLASFKPLINFGLLSGIVILLALIFDLLVLPAILGFLGKGSKILSQK